MGMGAGSSTSNCDSVESDMTVIHNRRDNSNEEAEEDVSKLRSHALTQEAIEEEHRGNIKEAHRLYSEAATLHLPPRNQPGSSAMSYALDGNGSGDYKLNNLPPPPLPRIDNDKTANPEIPSWVEEWEKPTKGFGEIIGCDKIKSELSLCFLVPSKLPGFFGENRKPYTSVLLGGPRGCGKMALARSLAAESGATFISVYAASLLASNYEKIDSIVAEVFRFARSKFPVVLYIKKVGILFPKDAKYIQGTGRIVAALALQLKQIRQEAQPGEFILIASGGYNPYSEDQQAKRLFDKIIQVLWPVSDDRIKLFKKFLEKTKNDLEELDFKNLAKEAAGLTPGQIEAVVRQAKFAPVQYLYDAKYFQHVEFPRQISVRGSTSLWTPCEESAANALSMTYVDVVQKEGLLLPPLTMAMIMDILIQVHPVRVVKEDPSHVVLPEINAVGVLVDRAVAVQVAEEEATENPTIKPKENKRHWYDYIFDCFFN